jgi:hypothetical protein
MNKQNVLYPYKGILFNSKNNMACMDRPQKHAKWKKPGPVGHIFIYRKCPD